MSNEIAKVDSELQSAGLQRRKIIAVGGLGMAAGAALLAGCSKREAPMAPGAPGAMAGGGTALLDKWLKTKKATLGFEFGSPPMQFRDPKTNQPTGYTVELTRAMFKDLSPDIEIEFSEMPFGQLVAAVQSRKVDMIEPITNLPTRAINGWFTAFPAAYHSVFCLVHKDSKLKSIDELKSASTKFAVLQGTSQQAAAKSTFPEAQVLAFPGVPEALSEVGSGRADATIQSLYTAINAIRSGQPLKVLGEDPLYVDSANFYIPEGDIRTFNWINNWLSYSAAHGTMQALWEKWVVTDAKKYGLPSVAVGAGGGLVKTS
ncbi:substrate-binding periplasmic protein [Pseudomonas azerbaijanoccidentalis]|jgi:polar amino acid transport system substrate-binding protein